MSAPNYATFLSFQSVGLIFDIIYLAFGFVLSLTTFFFFLSEVPTWERIPYSTLDLCGFLCLCVIFHAGPSTLEFSYLLWTVRQDTMHPLRPNSSLTFFVKPFLASPHTALSTCSLVRPLYLILITVMEIIDHVVLLLSICICIFPISL